MQRGPGVLAGAVAAHTVPVLPLRVAVNVSLHVYRSCNF